jgi:hypothetical protein
MVFAEAARRGAGTIVETNLVEDVFFARGIYLAGVVGVTVRGNTVRRTASGGIVAWQEIQAGGFSVPPIHDVRIVDNTVEAPIGIATPATGSWGAFGGISVVSAATGAAGVRFVDGRVNRRITITGNRVAESGRSGIWVSNLAGGSVRGNVITNHHRRPTLPIYGVAPTFHAVLEREFAQPVAVRLSDEVELP